MTVLVTGGAGFIGSALVRRLVLEEGERVVTLDAMTYAANPLSLADLEDHPCHRLVVGSIGDAPLVARLLAEERPRAIMNLAAETHVDRSLDGPAAFVATNVVGTGCLLDQSLAYWRGLEGADREAFRFLQVSTDEVFGALGPTGEFTQDSPFRPRSPYSASKAGGDHLASAYGTTYGLPVITTHCSNNYGPRQFPEKLLPLMILKALAQQPLPVYGTGTNVRDWLHVDDHVDALLMLLQRGEPGGRYLIGGGREMANLALVETLCDLLDQRRPRTDGKPHRSGITFVADRPGHDFRYAIDSSQLERAFGWRAKHAFESGLAATIDWYLANEDWWGPILDRYGGERLGLSRR